MLGENLEEGNMNESKADVTLRENGFAWRGGQDRQTTGIWMWSEPFIRKVSHSPEPIAILLIDTQGMFDNETTMALTAQIFGLSTLISSYQVQSTDDINRNTHTFLLVIYAPRFIMWTSEFKKITSNTLRCSRSMAEWHSTRTTMMRYIYYSSLIDK